MTGLIELVDTIDCKMNQLEIHISIPDLVFFPHIAVRLCALDDDSSELRETLRAVEASHIYPCRRPSWRTLSVHMVQNDSLSADFRQKKRELTIEVSYHKPQHGEDGVGHIDGCVLHPINREVI